MNYKAVLFFKIEVPTESLLSNERKDLFILLHETAAGIEQKAIKIGFSHAMAFAGGSCKPLFCGDQADCRVVSTGAACRNPGKARPSMSGFGIDVSGLMKSAGWKMNRVTGKTDPDAVPMGNISGLVLIC